MAKNRSVVFCALLLLSVTVCTATSGGGGWSVTQLAELRSLAITELEPPASDRTNRVADDPVAASLGERLFFDTRLSADGKVACGTCHQADRDFQDGIPLGRGVGVTAKRTMPIAASSRSPFLFWDGRKDSQWAQALGPLESAVEHGGTRAQYAHVVADRYRAEYEDLFGPLPDLSAVPPSAGPGGSPREVAAWLALTGDQRDAITFVFVNIGKAIAAYERLIDFGPAPFDRYVDAITNHQSGDDILTNDQIAGLKLFIGKANCSQCHNGPLLTNNEFHNTGVPPIAGLPIDDGRLSGAASVLADEFNCRSRWSDARQSCAEIEFLVSGDRALQRAYKVPSLRNVAARAPYMDAGQISSLAEVLDHYNRAPMAARGRTELKPLHLKASELRQIEAFLRSLTGPIVVSGRSIRPVTP